MHEKQTASRSGNKMCRENRLGTSGRTVPECNATQEKRTHVGRPNGGHTFTLQRQIRMAPMPKHFQDWHQLADTITEAVSAEKSEIFPTLSARHATTITGRLFGDTASDSNGDVTSVTYLYACEYV